MKPATIDMRDDVRARLKELGDGSMDDLSAELLLRTWRVTLTRGELMDGCYAVLTAGACPPWMSATIVAVNLIYENKDDAARQWDRLMAMSPVPGGRDTGWLGVWAQLPAL